MADKDLFWYEESDGESTTTSTSYQNKMQLDAAVPEDAKFLLEWNAEITVSSSSGRVYFRVRLDDTDTLAELEYEPESSNQWESVGGGFIVKDLLAGSRQLDLDYKSSSGSYTAKIRRARARIRRIN